MAAFDSCPHCGGALHSHGGSHSRASPSQESLEVVPDIGVARSDGAAGDRTGDDRQRVRATSRSRRRLFGAIGMAAVALGAVWLVFGRGNDPVEPLGDPAGEIAGGDDTTGDGANVGGTDGSGARATGGDPNFPPSDEHMAGDSVAQLFRSTINGDAEYAIVYPDEFGLQVLSGAGATEPALKVAFRFEEALRYPLFSDGTRTWAIDIADLSTAWVVSTQFVVVDISREGSVAFINTSADPVNIGISSFGAWGPGFDLPPGSDVLPVPGRGLLVLPETGGTFQLLTAGVEAISDDRVVAASVNAEIYKRCDDELNCELYLESDGTSELLEVPLEATLHPSPNGDWVFVQELDSSSLVRTDGTVWSLDVPAQAVSWSPDSRFVALMVGDEVVLAYPETRERESMVMPTAPAVAALKVVSSNAEAR